MRGTPSRVRATLCCVTAQRRTKSGEDGAHKAAPVIEAALLAALRSCLKAEAIYLIAACRSTAS